MDVPEAERLGPIALPPAAPVAAFHLGLYCAAARLAVEVDGVLHTFEDQARKDVARDRVLAERGIVTVRVAALDVMHNLDGVLQQIQREANARLR